MERKSSYGKKAGGKGPFSGERSFKGKEDRSGSFKKRDDEKGGSTGAKKSWGGASKSGDRGFAKASPRKRSFEKEEGDSTFKRSFDRKESGFKPRSGADTDRPKRPYEKREGGFKPRGEGEGSFDRPKRSYEKREGGFKPRGEGEGSFDRPKRSYEKREGGFKPRGEGEGGNDRPKRSYEKREGDFKPRRSGEDKASGFKNSFDSKGDSAPRFGDDRASFKNKGFKKGPIADEDSNEIKLPKKEVDPSKTAFKTPHKYKRSSADAEVPEAIVAAKSGRKRKPKHEDEVETEAADGPMPLNKYIAHSGECSRRDAAELVKAGKVKVNGELVTDPGYRVQDIDQVTLLGKKLKPIKDLVYVLLNKPKGYLTTTDDPKERATVMDLVEGVEAGRLYPVGRLDRNTSGLLLLTNDGDMAQKLSHPSYETKKVYHVTLDKPITQSDFDKVVAGVELEDGISHVDELAYLESKDELGLEIHSGKNRIVRRIFEALGYEVIKLDRVIYAGLTKKNLPRGKWRFLEEKEVILLKHFKQ